MGTRVPPVPMDPAAVAKSRPGRHDPDEMEALFSRMLSRTHNVLPDPPVSVDCRLFALLPHDSVDRISRLPDVLLGNIVSRLPVKEAARTAALSRRWRGVWRSTPLVLVDSHFLPAAAGIAVARADARRITSAISGVLAAHPGPFRCVHLTSCYMEEFHGLLTRWLQMLAEKGIQDLVLVNRPWPIHVPTASTFILPSTFLGMTTLTRLYLGLWKFPDTAGVKRDIYFPNLLELGLCTILMKSKDLDFILDRSPVLETLCVESNLFKLSLRLVSQSIRCVKIIMSFCEEIAVVDAPCLERLIISRGWTNDGVCTKVKIGHAPKLHSLGYLDSGNHILEFGNTVIKAGIKASPSTMVPSVRILALDVRCGVRSYGKMIPTVLRCFPNVETLHIMMKPLSGETGQPSGKHNLDFWNESGTIKCIRSCIKLLVFHDFRGDRNELAFLKFFFKSALVLKEVEIVMANGSFTSMEDMLSKVKPLGSMKRASADSSITINPQGGSIWNFKKASDFSLCDPFARN